MRKFMKKTDTEMTELTTDEVIEQFTHKKSSKIKFVLLATVVVAVVGCAFCAVSSVQKLTAASLENPESTIELASAPVAATSAKKSIISIPSGVTKEHPFLPYRNIGGENALEQLVNDVPKFDLIAPPEMLNENSEAAKVMDTVVSGILYDKFSPSAILNIEGNDYLVKKGDTVNRYKIIAIAQDSVTVQLGSNTFKAGIGEILTDGSVNYNDVSNLSRKFGGERR